MTTAHVPTELVAYRESRPSARDARSCCRALWMDIFQNTSVVIQRSKHVVPVQGKRNSQEPLEELIANNTSLHSNMTTIRQSLLLTVRADRVHATPDLAIEYFTWV